MIIALSTTPGHGGHEVQLADAEEAAATLGISVKAICPHKRATGPCSHAAADWAIVGRIGDTVFV